MQHAHKMFDEMCRREEEWLRGEDELGGSWGLVMAAKRVWGRREMGGGIYRSDTTGDGDATRTTWCGGGGSRATRRATATCGSADNGDDDATAHGARRGAADGDGDSTRRVGDGAATATRHDAAAVANTGDGDHPGGRPRKVRQRGRRPAS
uniref:Uncharacterized protein n=1 Tax=Oryza sativa subsp. japonica TaxID=39947 RepID=Q6EQJ2_ORYSJ|nr:hypothetical protein [Oryza sativa Japonica Group]